MGRALRAPNPQSEKEGEQVSVPITLTGRVVSDPELKFSASGVAVLNLRVVTNGRRKTDAGWEDVDTTFWSVSAFRQLAENCAESLVKGDLVLVTGKAKSREWTDKEGGKRLSWEVTADHIGADLTRNTVTVKRVVRDSVQADAWEVPAEDKPPF
jgi:single-strand DNA-binding protein